MEKGKEIKVGTFESKGPVKVGGPVPSLQIYEKPGGKLYLKDLYSESIEDVEGMTKIVERGRLASE